MKRRNFLAMLAAMGFAPKGMASLAPKTPLPVATPFICTETFTVPAVPTVTPVWVTMVGGGGGGSSSGGFVASTARYVVSPGDTFTVTIGEGDDEP